MDSVVSSSIVNSGNIDSSISTRKQGGGKSRRSRSEYRNSKRREYITELNDGTKVNTSEEFNSTKMYGELEISNIHYTEQNGKTVLLADVTNKGNTTHENEIVK